MKAAVLVEQNAPLELLDLDVPEPGVGQVVVKMGATGICGKQLEEISGKRGKDPFLPHLLGHEGAGIVDRVGPGVRKVRPGDRVVLHWMKGSGIDSETPRFESQGKRINAGWVTTFSEYTIASENRVTPIPGDVPFDIAALLGCAVTTGLGVVFNNANLKPGQSLAVFGVGGVGLNVIQGGALINAHPIVGVDLFDEKLSRASAFGASHVVNSGKDDPRALIHELSSGQGFDAVVDVTGNAEVRQLAYDLTSNKGITVFAGVPHHEDKFTVDSFPLHFGQRVIGSHGGETNPDVDIPRYIRLYQLGKLKLDELITHRYPLEDINTAVDHVRAGEAGRCVVTLSS